MTKPATKPKPKPAAPAPEAASGRTQRRWLMGLRLATASFLLLSLIFTSAYGVAPDRLQQWFIPGLGMLGLYYLLAVLFYGFPGQGRAAAFHRAAQVVADLALAVCLTLITGAGDSPYSFLFLLVIINSAFLGGIRTALVVATFSAALWGLLVTLEEAGSLAAWFPPLNGGRVATGWMLPKISDDRLARILVNTGSCYLVAFLSGHLAGQLVLSRRALVRSQAYLDRLADLNENIIQSIDSGLITLDRNGLILSVNRAGREILGRAAPDLTGRPWQMFLPQLEHILPLSIRNRAGVFDAGGLRFEYFREKDQRELLLELNVLALTDAAGDIWGRLLVVKDLTSLSRLEETVRKAEHLAALGELAAGLAHELRTPLASMTGACDLLAQGGAEPEDHQRLVTIIGREMERLAKLTNDFLSFARPARSTPRPFDLAAAVTDQLRLFEASRPPRVTVETRLTPLPPVYFDAGQFSQVWWNLLTNAVEAGAHQPELRLIVETTLDPAWPDHAALRLTDDGPGIPHEILPKLFEPFYTTKASGNGLGLAIVSRILHEGGGHISAASSRKTGTTFSVYLPLAGDGQP